MAIIHLRAQQQNGSAAASALIAAENADVATVRARARGRRMCAVRLFNTLQAVFDAALFTKQLRDIVVFLYVTPDSLKPHTRGVFQSRICAHLLHTRPTARETASF